MSFPKQPTETTWLICVDKVNLYAKNSWCKPHATGVYEKIVRQGRLTVWPAQMEYKSGAHGVCCLVSTLWLVCLFSFPYSIPEIETVFMATVWITFIIVGSVDMMEKTRHVNFLTTRFSASFN